LHPERLQNTLNLGTNSLQPHTIQKKLNVKHYSITNYKIESNITIEQSKHVKLESKRVQELSIEAP